MKIIYILILLLFIQTSAFAVKLEDISGIKSYSYRLGTTDLPEIKYSVIEAQKEEIAQQKTNQNTKRYKKTNNFSDVSLQKLANEMDKELKIHNDIILSDIRLLWFGAAQKSETITFAIYKLSNPEEDKTKNSFLKKIIQPLASFTSLASMGLGDPIASTSAIIGSNLLSAFSYNDKDLNYKYTKVNDADMVVLMGKIDDLQTQVLNSYVNYMTARGLMDNSFSILQKHKNAILKYTNNKETMILISDAYYREAQNNYEKYRNDFISKRSSLEQLVGTKTLKEFENNLNERMK